MSFKHSLYLSIAIWAVPILTTIAYKFVDSSIGPIVLFYSIIGGISLGIFWGKSISTKWNIGAGVLFGSFIGIIGMTLLINFFIWFTMIMGEMDYGI